MGKLMRKNNPFIAAGLCVVLGPFGFFYIGWRYGLLALLVLATLAVAVALTGFTFPWWIKYVLLPVLAVHSWSIVSVWNAVVDADDPEGPDMRRFEFATMAMTELLPQLGMWFAVAVGLYAAGILLVAGSFARAALVAFLATPFMAWIVVMTLGLVAMGLDVVVVGSSNIFRQRRVGNP